MAALNIAFEDSSLHMPEKYADLIMDLRDCSITVQGDRNVTINAYKQQSIPHAITGFIVRTTSIEAMKWFDTRTKEIVPEEGMKSINIPPSYQANYREFFFMLHLPSHKLIFETECEGHALSPRILQKFFIKAFEDFRIFEKYGIVHVNVETSQRDLEKILNSEGIRSLMLKINAPNPDGFWDDEEFFEEKLKKMNASSVDIIFSVPKHKTSNIKPDEDVKRIALVAASNGYVAASIKREGGKTREVSTRNYPIQEDYRYSPNKQTRWAAFVDGGLKLLERVLS